MTKCPEPELAQSGEVTELLRTHTANTGKAGQCRARQAKLIDLLERLKARCE